MNAVALYTKHYNQIVTNLKLEKDKSRTHSFSNLMAWAQKNIPKVDLSKVTEEEIVAPVSEILFSGGDPLTLPNSTLARYMVLMAEAGVDTIRLSTKELIFNPNRFDPDFFMMLDGFHDLYPHVELKIVGHYSHPFELVDAQTDADSGEYIYDVHHKYTLRKDMREALRQMHLRRGYVRNFNQFPIIAGVNDSVEVLSVLFKVTQELGIEMHNTYACREIVGKAHFRKNNDIVKQFKMLEEATKLGSDTDNGARFMMCTDFGKLRIHGEIEIETADGKKEKRVVLQLNRYVEGRTTEETGVFTVNPSVLDSGIFFWLGPDDLKRDGFVDARGHALLTKINSRGWAQSPSLTGLVKAKAAAVAKIAASQLHGLDNDQAPKSCEDTSFATIKVMDSDILLEDVGSFFCADDDKWIFLLC